MTDIHAEIPGTHEDFAGALNLKLYHRVDHSMEEDIMKQDLYGILGVPFDSKVELIKKAYRKRALKCHPDKNPDDRTAAKNFHLLTKAFEALCDEKIRAKYDQLLKSKEAARLRDEQLDKTRRKLKRDLERREQEAEKQDVEAAKQRKLDILRAQGQRDIEEEAARIRQQKACRAEERYNLQKVLTVRWKAEKNDPTNGGYNEENLRRIFSKWGAIENLIVMESKKGRAVVEYHSPQVAERAAKIEIGYPSNPLKIKRQ